MKIRIRNCLMWRKIGCVLIVTLLVNLYSCSLKNRAGSQSEYKKIEKNGDLIIEDPVSGLFWQRDIPKKGMIWKEAEKYCSELEYGGFDDWRMPTISELKTLIKGCKSGTEKCRVDNKCRNPKCIDDNCYCSENRGPGEDGFYWQKKIWNYKGDNMGSFWSSSVRPNHKFFYWGISFNNGGVDNGHRKSEFYVRCVRSK